MSGFDKVIDSTISEYEIYNVQSTDELEKVASANVDLPEGFVFDPDYLYMWVRIISAGEYYGPNKNGDYFPEEELLRYYDTFKTAHVFKNHENKKVENAIGEIISVRWNPIMKCVEIFKGIDRKIAPEIVRGFLKGYLTDVSMGCKVPYTVCSVCGNKARRQSEFCNHVKSYRNQYLGNGERVFEINFEPKFHDSSAVLTGAERVAKALVIIDKPPADAAVSFKKVASANGTTRYIKLSDAEMQKVAHYNSDLHSLLTDSGMAKEASSDSFMRKIAELEKEVTGKLLNLVSAPEDHKQESANQMLAIIKFLTEKRMDSKSLDSIASTLRGLSKSQGVPVHQSFSTLLGVAELLGIEFFPQELHQILSGLTDAGLVDELNISTPSSSEVYPTDFTKGIKKTLAATEMLPEFSDPSNLFELYNEGAHNTEALKHNLFGFLEGIHGHSDLDAQPSMGVVKVVKQMLEPLMPARSRHGAHLLPRISIVLSGHKPIIGGEEASRDVEILSNPKTLGDVMAAMAYKNYQGLRPKLTVTRLIKMAMYGDPELEKTAARDYMGDMKEQSAYNQGVRKGKKEIADQIKEQKKNAKNSGLKAKTLIFTAVPAAYGASLFQKNRRENGKYLSDAENFIADNPGVMAVGGFAAGKVGSKAIANGINRLTGKDKPLHKLSEAVQYEEFVKQASNIHESDFSAFDTDFLKKFASESGFTGEETAALKVATLLSVGGMDKEANEVLSFYNIDNHAKGMFLKKAAEYADAEMDKAANDFVNTLVLDSLVDNRSMSSTLPGRMVDAFVFKKLGEIGNDKEKKKKKDGPDLVEPFNADKGPAPYEHMRGGTNA